MKTLMCRESFDPTKIRNIPLTAKPNREYLSRFLHLFSIIFPMFPFPVHSQPIMPIMPNGPKATRLLVPCLAALGEGINKA